jgi:hypothetical protein
LGVFGARALAVFFFAGLAADFAFFAAVSSLHAP